MAYKLASRLAHGSALTIQPVRIPTFNGQPPDEVSNLAPVQGRAPEDEKQTA